MGSVCINHILLVGIYAACFHFTGAVTQTGKVYIGVPGNLSTSLSFPETQTQGNIQVFVQVEVTENGVTKLEDINSNVTISCSYSPHRSGYSEVIFTSVDIEAPNISAPNFTTEPLVLQIPFSVIAAGRSVELRCWGESVLNAGENQIQENNTSPQFTKKTSISAVVMFSIRRKGTVNICYDIVVVPNKATDNKGEFLVELSEPVALNTDVVITCDVQVSDPSNPSDPMELVIQPALVTENELKIMMSYERTKGIGALTVTCKGQSVYKVGNDSFDGDQFQNSTSRGDPVLFVIDIGHVTIYPGSTFLETSEMRLFLVLDASVTSDVSFTCSAETVNSTAAAVSIANDPFCETITQEVITRPVGNISEPAGNPGVRPTGTQAPLNKSSSVGNETSSDNETQITQGTRSPSPEFADRSINLNTTDKPVSTIIGRKTTTDFTTQVSRIPTIEPPSICYSFQRIKVNETVIIETLVNGSLVNMTVETSRFENVTKAVNCSDITPVTSPSTPSENENRTVGEWLIRNPSIDFKEGGPPHQVLLLERVNMPTAAVQEFVVVTCCAPGLANTNPKYSAKSAAVFIVASLTPNITVNWTDASAPSENTDESSIPNPAYVEVAPCSCDLTEGSCDLGCCCDKHCTDSDKATFDCIPGVAGGFPAPLPQYSCASSYPIREDWFPFMCVHAENSAFLGYYFFPSKAIRSQIDFNTKAQGKKQKYTYKGSDKRSQFPRVSPVGYRQGDNLRTGLVEKSVDDNIITGNNFQLGVPQESLMGECVTTSPVRYLEDVETKCSHVITKELCHSNSVLSASMYVQPTTLTHPPCPKSPVILKSKGTKEVTEVAASYLCISTPNSYLKSVSYFSDFVKDNQKSLFSNVDFDTSLCDFDPVTNVYICQSNSEGEIISYNLTRCSWDDSYFRAPTPIFNETLSICQNAVIDIHYNFTWKGGEVLLLNATYIMADLPTELERVDSFPVLYEEGSSADANNTIATTSASVTAAENSTALPPNIDYGLVDAFSTVDVIVTKFPAVLSQKIGVAFWQKYVYPNITQDSETEEAEIRKDRYKRSGKMGYENDLPVFSGVPKYNQTNGGFSYMDIEDKSRLSLWQPGPSGLCSDAGRQVLQFGQDGTSSCTLRLGLTELHNNCSNLRQQILHHQDALMRSSYISRNGDPSVTNLQHWIQIIRENISSILLPDEVSTTTASMTTSGNFTTQSKTTVAPTTTDLNSTAETVTNGTSNATTDEPGPDEGGFLDESIGICPDIPSGIHVDIMYAQSGAVNSIPLYEIVGAKVSYTLSDWRLTCMGARGLPCLGKISKMANDTGEEAVQSFYLSSSVKYILVPSQQPEAKTRYQLRHEEERSVCKGDACWEELFYPILSIFQGDSFQYTRTVAMTTSLFVLGYFYVTKPWW